MGHAILLHATCVLWFVKNTSAAASCLWSVVAFYLHLPQNRTVFPIASRNESLVKGRRRVPRKEFLVIKNDLWNAPDVLEDSSKTLRLFSTAASADLLNAHCPLADVPFPLVLRRKTEHRRHRTNETPGKNARRVCERIRGGICRSSRVFPVKSTVWQVRPVMRSQCSALWLDQLYLYL